MGTGLMQWTAAEMEGMQCDAMDCFGFVNVLGLCFHAGCELTTPNPSALRTMFLVSVKFCDRGTGTNLRAKERNKRSQRSSSRSITYRHLSRSPFCHVLLCSLWRHFCHYQSWYSCACTPFSDVWRYKRGPKITWLVTQSTSSTITTHHHDESLLL